MIEVLQWERKEEKPSGRQNEQDWRLNWCQDRGGREGRAKNEAHDVDLVTSVAGGIIHQMRNSEEEQVWGGCGERAEFAFGHVECETKTSKQKCSVDSGM